MGSNTSKICREVWRIVSSTVSSKNASGSLTYGIGCADSADGIVPGLSSGVIEIMPTLVGDCQLQGKVNFSDYQILAEYFGKSVGWDEGDFHYAGVVNFGDYQLLADNFGANDSLLF